MLQYGKNVLPEARRRSASRIFVSQFLDFMVLVLLGAALIAAILGEPQDTVAILLIVGLNTVLGFVQEYRAERAIEALQAISALRARAKRGGRWMTIPAYELVPGDIVQLEAGDLIPADVRLAEAVDLRVDESSLTGESVPIDKISEPVLADQLPIAEQKNMAFRGTAVVRGRGVGIVVRTGLETELGKIAKLLREEVEVKTPLQNRLTRFARKLALVVVVLCVVIFVTGLVRGENPVLMFLTALSLAVAAIPEALPAVVTVSLGLGARRMVRRRALVRKLSAVEALGSVTWICSDKTGTLTENKMQVQGFHLEGQFALDPPPPSARTESWDLFLKILAQNNDATVGEAGRIEGDPTEVALVHVAMQAGYDKGALDLSDPRIAEIPFSSERGLMTTLHRAISTTKGSPERVFPLCKNQISRSGRIPFDLKKEQAAVEAMAKRGLRVLALAFKDVPAAQPTIDRKTLERDLTYVGLVGMIDPPRPEAKESVSRCKTAGIRVVMMTGDHVVTARAIAVHLGILESEDPETHRIITGPELDTLSDEDLLTRVRDVSVYARAVPEQKIRIVKALQRAGEIVAMTGDGVNDAPALRRSDVGVAMGRGGTDVAREAAHMVLLDDNFATIVTAVGEGRRIYDNIRKFVRFALTGNSGEIWTLFLAPFLGLPLPLLPAQILWVNLVTDGLPGLALAVEPEEEDLMMRPPRAPQEGIFARGLWQHALWAGLLIAAVTLVTLEWAYRTGHAHWRSMAFTVLTLAQMGHVLAIRSERGSIFRQGLFSNRALVASVGLTFVLQMALLYVPALGRVFEVEPLSIRELLFCLVMSSSVFIAVEIEKWATRHAFGRKR